MDITDGMIRQRELAQLESLVKDVQRNLAAEEKRRAQLYTIFRDYIKHEDDLINLRLNWNFTIQGFLFAAYALSLQKIVEVKGQILKLDVGPSGSLEAALGIHELRFLMLVIAVVGLLVSACVYLSVWAARLAATAVENKWWQDNFPDEPRPTAGVRLRYLLLGKYSGSKILKEVESRKLTHVKELPGLCGGGESWAKEFGYHAPAYLPIILIVAWSALAVYSFIGIIH